MAPRGAAAAAATATTVQHQWRHVIRKEHVSSPALLPERYFFCTLFSVLCYSHSLLSFFLSLSFVRKYLRTYPYPSIYIYTSVLLSLPLFLSLSPSIYLSLSFYFAEHRADTGTRKIGTYTHVYSRIHSRCSLARSRRTTRPGMRRWRRIEESASLFLSTRPVASNGRCRL